MKQNINEIKRMQRLAGLITESEYQESSANEEQYYVHDEEGMEEPIGPFNLDQAKAELAKQGTGWKIIDAKTAKQIWSHLGEDNAVSDYPATDDKGVSTSIPADDSPAILDEYEVIYVWQGSDCYRKDDEGNYDKVNPSYCQRYAQEDKECFECWDDSGSPLDGQRTEIPVMEAETSPVVQRAIRDLKNVIKNAKQNKDNLSVEALIELVEKYVGELEGNLKEDEAETEEDAKMMDPLA